MQQMAIYEALDKKIIAKIFASTDLIKTFCRVKIFISPVKE